LLHELPEEAYSEFLVRKFYDGFGKRDIDHHNGRITVRWDGTLKVVDLELISGITGIPMRDGDISMPLPIDDYLPWMGRDCVKRDGGGIKTSSVYRNVYATGRWIKANILGSMHVSSFYREELHIIHALMTRDRKFCMVRKLFGTLCSVKEERARHPNILLPLPCLVTDIVGSWITREDFQEELLQAITLRAPTISSSYGTCLQVDWIPTEIVEDQPMPQRRESSSSTSASASTGDSHFDKEVPTDVGEALGFLHRGQKKIWNMLKKLVKKKKKKYGGESDAPPPERPTRMQPLRRCTSGRGEGSSQGPSRHSFSEGGDWSGSQSQHW
jgi:hypothetical protein